MSRKTVFIVSDIHYACEAEQTRRGHEMRAVKNPFARGILTFYRDYIWLKNPTGQNHLLDQFLLHAQSPDFVVSNGDYSCNTAFVGLADDAACRSAQECLGILRKRFEPNFRAAFGDHELGKVSLVGNHGGMRLASWRRSCEDARLEPFWTCEFGNYVFIGVVSSLIALPVFEPETLPEERQQWHVLRQEHMGKIRNAFASLKPRQRVILFCHDPTALPFLWRDDAVRSKISQIHQTVIGHLHSPLILWKSRLLAGMPVIRFMGNSIRRFSEALHEARHWREFKVKLCPSLGGIELLKDGGFLKMTIELDASRRPEFERVRIIR
jgi:hypothetical protein